MQPKIDVSAIIPVFNAQTTIDHLVKGYDSTSAGWRRLTRGPGLSMEDAVLASAGNYEQNDCARGTQDMMPFYVWRGDGGLFHQYQ